MKQRASAQDAAMQEFTLPRPFGESGADLELDFSGGARPDLVTHLLCACLRDADERAPAPVQVWDWTLHRRLQALIAIECAGGATHSTLQLTCPRADCGELMELDLDLERFRMPGQPAAFDVAPAPGVRLSVRLPCGADQRRWHTAADTGEAIEVRAARELVQAVNGTPLGEGVELSPQWMEPLAAALEQRDPLTALSLTTRCPACGEALTVDFDLEHHLLLRAQARQQRLLDAVHVLARAYHWSEREILALPRRRREQYLARVRAEAAP